MIPRDGDIVMYHFMNSFPFVDSQQVTSRPAIVIRHLAPVRAGHVFLHVFFGPGDTPVNVDRYDLGAVDATAHQEPAAEMGKQERETPKPGTWSWRKN